MMPVLTCRLAACLFLPLFLAAAYDKVVLALMSDPEVAEDLFSVMSPGEHQESVETSWQPGASKLAALP
jgi:hypothetical protein